MAIFNSYITNYQRLTANKWPPWPSSLWYPRSRPWNRSYSTYGWRRSEPEDALTQLMCLQHCARCLLYTIKMVSICFNHVFTSLVHHQPHLGAWENMEKYVKPSCLLITWSHIPIYILGVGQIHGTVKSDVEAQISLWISSIIHQPEIGPSLPTMGFIRWHTVASLVIHHPKLGSFNGGSMDLRDWLLLVLNHPVSVRP